MRFHHLGIPTDNPIENPIELPHLKMTVSDHMSNPNRIQYMQFWDDAPYPEIVKSQPHIAYEVDNLQKELEGKKIIIEPNSPSEGLTVAFVEVNGILLELMEYQK